MTAFAASALVFGTVALELVILKPPRFDAECVIRLVPRASLQSTNTRAPGPGDVRLEIDRIRSKETFLALIGTLSLERYYERKSRAQRPMNHNAVLVNASSQTDVTPGPSQETLRIHVMESDPTMAAAMANELAAIHGRALAQANLPLASTVLQPATVPLHPNGDFAVAMRIAVLLGSIVVTLLTGGVAWVFLQFPYRRAAG